MVIDGEGVWVFQVPAPLSASPGPAMVIDGEASSFPRRGDAPARASTGPSMVIDGEFATQCVASSHPKPASTGPSMVIDGEDEALEAVAGNALLQRGRRW